MTVTACRVSLAAHDRVAKTDRAESPGAMFQGTENDASDLGAGVVQPGWAFPVPRQFSVLVLFGLDRDVDPNQSGIRRNLPRLKLGRKCYAPQRDAHDLDTNPNPV